MEDSCISSGRKLAIRRIIGAPREKVFEAWTDSKQLGQWWGPRGFTNPLCEFDPHPGGAIRIDMRGPDGTVYPTRGVVKEIVAPERITVATSAIDDSEGNPQLEDTFTVTLSELNGMTELHLNVELTRVAGPAAEMAIEGMEQGWTESLFRLADFLDSMPIS
jgi:uncharacterized protein YndB with AHSA1/START domain